MNTGEAAPVKVLVADDDQIYREILQEAIVREGAEVSLAADGTEALGKLEEESFDVLISDLYMPGMDGLNLLRHVRQHYPHILTIIVTGFGSLESAVEAIRLGAYDYVQKPFKMQEIMVTARNAIDKVVILRERTGLLQEIEALHQRLLFLEQAEGRPQQEDVRSPAEDPAARPYYYYPHHQTMPLDLLDAPQETPNRILAALESLKDLRREGIINEQELNRLKKAIIGRLEPGRS